MKSKMIFSCLLFVILNPRPSEGQAGGLNADPVAGQTIGLDSCLAAAVDHAPRTRDRAVLLERQKLVEQNIRTNWLPSLELNGKATYQSDVVTIEFDNTSIPVTFPEMPHDQYSLNLDIRQTIYDGGMNKSKTRYEQSKTAAGIQEIEVESYAVREQVTGLFFAVLVSQENRKNLGVMLDNLKTREKHLVSALEHGIVMENDLRVIRVEILKLLQSLAEIDAARLGALEMLAVITGLELGPSAILEMPYLELDESQQRTRPELELFNLQQETIEAGKSLAAAQRMPKVFAYGQAGYGRPGYNMLSTDFDTYYLLGAGLKWNIWDWNTTRREKQILEASSRMIDHARQSFNLKLDASAGKAIESMKQLKNSLELDKKILEMRMEITRDAAAKLDNGVMSSTTYMLELNKETAARIKQSIHQIQLLQSMANYKICQGTL